VSRRHSGSVELEPLADVFSARRTSLDEGSRLLCHPNTGSPRAADGTTRDERRDSGGGGPI
jgi:hypothetical protein